MKPVPIAAASIVALATHLALADETLILEGMVTKGGLDHEFVDFEVPAGVGEIEVRHDDLSDATILDWGLYDPSGFRGWGGGNTEPAIVNATDASRSYLPGPMTPGTWRVVIGKAKLAGDTAPYHIEVELRDAPTLPRQDRRPFVAAAPLAVGRRFYAGDFHVHSLESGDANATFDEILAYARGQGLDFVELSDHNTTSQLDFLTGAQATSPDVLLLRGIEYTTYAGHGNIIGAASWVDHKIGQPGVDIATMVDAVHAQGALFSINHPSLDLGDACIGCAWKQDLPLDKIDAVEIATGDAEAVLGDRAIAFWDSVCASGRHAVPIGGSDDHRAGRDIGVFGAPIGTPATYVFADELSEAGILAGLRRGKTVVKVNGTSGPMIDLLPGWAWESDVLAASNPRLDATITGGVGLEARWVKNGQRAASIPITSDPMTIDLSVVAPATGEHRYRVEVVDGGGIVVALTSHVWVTFAEGEVTGGACGVEPSAGNARGSNAGALAALGGALVAAAALVIRVKRSKRKEEGR